MCAGRWWASGDNGGVNVGVGIRERRCQSGRKSRGWKGPHSCPLFSQRMGQWNEVPNSGTFACHNMPQCSMNLMSVPGSRDATCRETNNRYFEIRRLSYSKRIEYS